MTKDLTALDNLIDKAIATSKKLDEQSKALAEKDKQYAEFLKTIQVVKEEEAMLWSMAKDFMEENGITEHENDFVKLTLSPSGKYRLTEGTDIDDVDDNLCDIKKVLSNRKVKAYFGLNNSLPNGVESTGNVLRKKLK